MEDTVKRVNLTRPWSSFSTTPLRFPQRLKIAKPESRAPLSAPDGGKRLSLPEMCKERQHLRLSSSSFPFCVMWVMGLVCYTAVFCVVMQRSAPQGALRDDTKKRLSCGRVLHGWMPYTRQAHNALLVPVLAERYGTCIVKYLPLCVADYLISYHT